MKYIPNVPIPRLPANMPKLANYIPGEEDNKHCTDEASRKERAEVLQRQRWNAFFYGIQQIFTFVSAPLIAIGANRLLDGISAIKQAGDALSIGTLMAESTGSGIVGLALLGGATVTIGIAIISNQIHSRIHYAASFDQLEIQSQHIGKYVGKAVKQELGESKQQPQAQQVAAFDNPDAKRTDDKTWDQYLDEQRAANNNDLKR